MLKVKINRLITYIFFIICSAISYSQDNYIFDSNRIKKVFCQWELTKEKNQTNYFMRLYNKKEDIFLDISTYAKGDNKKIAEKRFYDLAINDGYSYIETDNISDKILGEKSKKYIGIFKDGKRIKNQLFFDQIKISIGNSSSEEEYIKTLKLIKEAIDPTIKIKDRTPIDYGEIYQVKDMFDVKKLSKSIKKYNRYVDVLEEAKGNNEVGSRISFALDDSGKAVVERSIMIEANVHFSKKVQERRWKNFAKYLSFKNPVIDNTSIKYFGVPSIQMKSTQPQNYGYDTVGIANIIITEDYTIWILNYVLNGDKELQKVEYNELLELTKRALKEYKK
ncbi:hypothetical protein [uncultured Fusobacterium sp.]|uniref:hypothetical protein n=1 Tax=uncultured Fusobacterium sp. TaxID=159267 RepID=UPI0028041972|nr:hypothetical protein [uncultured Fusobacterium sp.]